LIMGWASIRDKYVKPALGGAIFSEDLTGTDLIGGITGQTAADATTQATQVQAQAQREQLDYLKEINRLPQQYREQALTQLAGAYGLPGAEAGAGQQFTQGFEASPFYQQYLAGQGAGEESVLRHAGATGGLRSGDVQTALSREATAGRGQALQQYVGGLQGLSGTPTYSSQIGQGIAGIGQTQAQGITGAAQAQQAGLTNTLNLGLGALGFLI
jgi:hypothetical protein